MLTLIKETGFRKTPSDASRKIGLFKCKCGNEKEICISNVRRGVTKSCGCLNILQATKLGKLTGNKKSSFRHGDFGTKFYSIYFGIVHRTKGNTRFYENIKNEWDNYLEFKNDMYQEYLKHVKAHGEKQTTIDRIDPSKNYSKDNCRWATYKEQGNNRKNNRLITFNNKTQTLIQWANEIGIGRATIARRIDKYKWPTEKALTQKVK